MSNDFNASVVISTKESEAGIRQLDSAARDLDKTLQNLHKSLQTGQGDLDSVAKSMTALTRANAELVRSEQARAKATVLAAKADGQMIVNQNKRQDAANRTAIAEAKAAKIRQSTLSSGLSQSATVTRRDAEARARMAATEAVTQARVASELTRGAVAQQNLATATARTANVTAQGAAAQQRYAGATRSAQSGTLALNDSLSNSRYLLYDVGQTYAVMAAALQVIPVATAAVAIAYERDFAQVQRTNDTLKGAGFKELREDLKQLATQIPLTFGEFANITTIGGQLGIEGKNIESFTETVARFGAASNVSLDEAATAFGRLQNSYDPMKKDADFFNKVGSAIAYVGVKSAATESEIIAVNNQISAAGATFGFTADEIVGLSGALASIRIRPELARGAFQRIMLGLSRAADEGGESFNKFGKYTGLAADEAQALFRNDPSAFFYKYIGGIKGAIQATGSASAVLDDIGAKNVFDKQFILGLSNGYKVFGDTLGYADKAFAEGSFLNESTQGVFNTMDAKLKRITSSVQNFTDTIGKGSLPGLSAVADNILGIVNAADRFAQATPGFTTFINLVLGLGSAVGILLAFKAAQAFLLAGLVGFQQVLGKGTLAAGLTAKGILQQVAVTMLMHKGATQASAQALVAQAGAFKAMGVAAQTSAAQVKAGTLAGIGGVSNAAPVATSRIGAMGGALKGAATSMLAFAGGPVGVVIGALSILGLSFITAGEQASAAGDKIARAMDNGADAGIRAAGEALTEVKVSLADTVAWDLWGKNLRQIANESGVSFSKLSEAATKGKDAVAAITPELDRIARSKGFKDFEDFYARGGTDVAGLVVLRNKLKDIADQSTNTSDDLKSVEQAVTDAGGAATGADPSMESLAAEIGGVGDESKTASEKIDDFIDSIFGMVDAAGNTQAALQGLGESLAESTDFSPNTEGGRANVEGFREALKAAAQEQQWLIENTGKSTQQASADYIAFVQGLVDEMVAHGVDPTNVQILADQAKQALDAGLNSGAPAQLKVDGEAAKAEATNTANEVNNKMAGIEAGAVKLNADGSQAINTAAGVEAYASSVARDYGATVSADSSNALENTGNAGFFMRDITGQPYEAQIGADTSTAILNLQNLAAFAQNVLSAIQYGLGMVGNGINAKKSVSAEIGNVRAGSAKRESASAGPVAKVPTSAPVIPKTAAPAVAMPKAATPNFGALNDGYNKVKNAAKGAGDAGKKAGNDMANGIDDAAQAADDYANRLKQGLTSAFDKQYGVQKATDDYYSTLNDINKRRDDELKQIEELISKQKELNDEVREEEINARKAGIEKDISLKYGEVDRAADYAQQEQEALNAADAKRKDIAANNAQIISLRAGIGELNGYSEAAITNREALRNLESKMLDMVVAYANTGASVEQVRAYAQRLTAQFQVDAGQIFQNQGAINGLTGNMQRYVDTVNRVPYHKPTTVTADVGGPGHGAIGAVNAFNGSADWAARPRTMTVSVDTSRWERNWWDAVQRVGRYLDGINNMPALGPSGRGSGIPVNMNYAKGGTVQGFSSGGLVPGRAPSDLSKDNMFAKVDGKGFVGIQSEEFVMQKRAVDFWGTDVMNAMNSMKMPHFSAGGSVGGGRSAGGGSGPMLVELTAENLQAILRLAERDINLFAGVEQIASSANEGNRILATKGVSG